jgi:predicted  nucleic acid-binding Zn-ribbon protein
MTIREIELQQQLDRRDAFIITLEAKLNNSAIEVAKLKEQIEVISKMIRSVDERIDKNKHKIKTVDFKDCNAYINLSLWTSEIIKWQEEINMLFCVQENMGIKT